MIQILQMLLAVDHHRTSKQVSMMDAEEKPKGTAYFNQT